MAIWKSPFNKVVRSKEALIIGVLLGLAVGGVVEGFLIPTVIKGETYDNPMEICGGHTKVKDVTIRFDGKLLQVECTDGRKIKL